MTWERRGEGSSYQREGRNDSWVPGPAYREKAGVEGMNVQAYDRAREWKETQRTQQGPGAARYSRQEYHIEAMRIESSQGNQEHKRASSSNVNHGKNRHRNRGGGSSRNGQQSEYSDKRPRNV
ncbi:hypothetical protein QCA50_014697 [Cerrena zonata]|uniref:Uncharacterized protein n=1 Tax=Cerrena zonata TaxID=2478898 RepID=A0AAW0FXL3_9APHY